MYEFLLSEKLPYQAERLFIGRENLVTLPSAYASVLYLEEGKIRVGFPGFEGKQINEGQLILLPQGPVYTLLAEEDVRFIRLHIPNLTALYIHFISSDAAAVPDPMEAIFHPLDRKEPINRLFEDIRHYLEDFRMSCPLAGIKTLELFHFIKHCYSKQNIQQFFSSIRTDEYAFALLVFSNYTSVRTAEELAERANYSFSGFDKQFRKVFGLPPYQWMLLRKKERLQQEISETTKPLKLIAEEYGFPNLSNMGDFCRKHIGLSPSMIRKKNIR